MKIHIKSIKSLLVFFVGFLVYVLCFRYGIQIHLFSSQYMVSLIVLYILLSVAYTVSILSPFLGDESPSAKIVLFVQEHPFCTNKQIIQLFDNALLIDKRLHDLTISGLIEKNGNYYHIKPNGNMFVTYILLFRTIIGWKRVG